MKRFIILIGLPGSGKSTLASQLAKRGFHVLNADSIREELFGDITYQGQPEKVFSLLFERLEDALSKGLDVVVDNTNLNPKHRKPLLERARKFDYQDIQLWQLDVPLATCLERNKSRSRMVPDEAINYMHTEFNRKGLPRSSEGKLIIVRPGKDETDWQMFTPII